MFNIKTLTIPMCNQMYLYLWYALSVKEESCEEEKKIEGIFKNTK